MVRAVSRRLFDNLVEEFSVRARRLGLECLSRATADYLDFARRVARLDHGRSSRISTLELTNSVTPFLPTALESDENVSRQKALISANIENRLLAESP